MFEEIFKKGAIIHTPLFLFKYQKTLEKQGLFSFVVSKNIYRSAVKRNSLRRKGYNTMRSVGNWPPVEGIFIFKKIEKVPTTLEIAENIRLIFQKIR